MTLAVYSPARARQLRFLLWAAAALAAAFLALAVLVVLAGSPRFGLFLGTSSALALLTAVVSLRLLAERGRPARNSAAVAGVLLMLVGLLVANAALSVLPTIVGVLLVLVALVRDHGERED